MNSASSTTSVDRPRPAPRGERTPPAPRSISSQVLFGGAREIVIEHAGSEYRLRITRQGKLILNK